MRATPTPRQTPDADQDSFDDTVEAVVSLIGPLCPAQWQAVRKAFPTIPEDEDEDMEDTAPAFASPLRGSHGPR